MPKESDTQEKPSNPRGDDSNKAASAAFLDEVQSTQFGFRKPLSPEGEPRPSLSAPNSESTITASVYSGVLGAGERIASAGTGKSEGDSAKAEPRVAKGDKANGKLDPAGLDKRFNTHEEYLRRHALEQTTEVFMKSLGPKIADNADVHLDKMRQFIKELEPAHPTAVEREAALYARMATVDLARLYGKPAEMEKELRAILDKHPEAVTDKYTRHQFADAAGSLGLFKDAKFLSDFERSGGNGEHLFSRYRQTQEEVDAENRLMQPILDIEASARKTGKVSDEQLKTMKDFIAERDKTPQDYDQWRQGALASNKLVAALHASGDTQATIQALADQARKYPLSLTQSDMVEIAGRSAAEYDPRFRDAFREAMPKNTEITGADRTMAWDKMRSAREIPGNASSAYFAALGMTQFPNFGTFPDNLHTRRPTIADTSIARESPELVKAGLEHNRKLMEIHERNFASPVSRAVAKELRLQSLEQHAKLGESPSEIRDELLSALRKYPDLSSSPRFRKEAVAAGSERDHAFMQTYKEITGRGNIWDLKDGPTLVIAPEKPKSESTKTMQQSAESLNLRRP